MTNTKPSESPTAILVPGFWLGAWAWREVEPGLSSAGINPIPVTLPGLDGSPTNGLTLDDHIGAVLALVENCAGDVILVGHSGGATVVQGVVDRRPERITRVIYIDAGPLVDGSSLRPGAAGDVPLPSWDDMAAEQLSVEGLDEEARADFRNRAVDHPGGVARSALRVSNHARLDVPTTVVCTSLPSEVLRGLIQAGQIPSELLEMANVRYVDLPTGHWPMFSRPTDLAEALVAEIGLV